MLQLCKVTKCLFISDGRSACSEDLLQQEAITLCINVSRLQPFPSSQTATIRVPVYDDPNQDLYHYFDPCADAIADEADKGGHCVVYCKNGRSRSATICIAYLMKHRQLSLKDAFQKVKTSRSVVDPNPGFWAQLEKYELELNRIPREDKAPTS